MGWCSPDEFEGLGSSRVRGVQDAGRHTNERRARDLALWLQQRWWVKVRVRVMVRLGVSILVDVLGVIGLRGGSMQQCGLQRSGPPGWMH